MKNASKISPSLQTFLDEQSSNTQREAIVILDGTDGKLRFDLGEESHPLSGSSASIKNYIEPLQNNVREQYAKVWKKQYSTREHPLVEPIGDGLLPVVRVSVTRNTLLDLAELSEVVAILPNLKISPIEPKEIDFENVSNDERLEEMTWGIRELGLENLWKAGHTGKGITVGVLDTGVYGEHPALKDKISHFVVVDPLGNRIETAHGATFDADRHGTHVCGTIAGRPKSDGFQIGVAPDATLAVAAVLVGRSTLLTLFAGLDWAVRQKCKVINMSLGLAAYEPRLSEFARLLITRYNIVPVAAIGNSNHGNSSSPGNAPPVLSVGALQKGYKGRVSVPFFSSGVSLIVPDAANGEPAIVTKPDVVAPGVQIYSCVPPEERTDGIYEYAYMDGTSMSAPHVSGVAALLRQAVPDATAADVIACIRDTASFPSHTGVRPDNRFGMGIIRPEKALECLQIKCRKET